MLDVASIAPIIKGFVIPAAIIPFFAPLLMDVIAYMYVSIMNRVKGRPTWIVGTTYERVVAPNAYVMEQVTIIRVTLRFVYLSTSHGTVEIKKRDMFKMMCFE